MPDWLLGPRRPRLVAAPAPSPWPHPAGAGAGVRAALDAWGLPWRTPTGELARRFGVRADDPYYGVDAIEVDCAPPFAAGLLGRVEVQVLPGQSPHLPPTSFGARTWFGPGARENLEQTAKRIAAHLGAPAPDSVSNTVAWRWGEGPSVVTATVWPPELQRDMPPNPSEDRDPRLRTACRVGIQTGFRPPLAPGERAAAARFTPVAELPRWRPWSADEVRAAAASDAVLEYVRAPEVDLAPLLGRVGHDGGRTPGRLVLACTDQLYVVPAERVARVEVHRATPAKGGGGAWMELACRASHDASFLRTLPLARHGDTHGLDDLAAAVAADLGVPLALGEPFPDC